MASIRTQNLRRKTVICQKQELKKWRKILKDDMYRIIHKSTEHIDLRTNKLTGKSIIIGEKGLK